MATTKDYRAGTDSGTGYEAEVMRLTKNFVHRLWSHDVEWCNNRVTPDFMWIGTTNEQYATSQQGFRALYEKIVETYPRSSITDEEYVVLSADERASAVAGRFLALTPTDNEHISAQWHRCTFVLRRVGRKVLISHLHLSSPVDVAKDLEGYPIAAGTETYRYMKSLMRLGSSRKSVSLYDVDGTVHWVHPSQIIYLEASRKRTVVHCMTKNIVVPAVIRDACEMVDGKIMRVHRSYAVNRDHVVELKGGRLLLDDGTSIAIPAKRLADVRANLTVN